MKDMIRCFKQKRVVKSLINKKKSIIRFTNEQIGKPICSLVKPFYSIYCAECQC